MQRSPKRQCLVSVRIIALGVVDVETNFDLKSNGAEKGQNPQKWYVDG